MVFTRQKGHTVLPIISIIVPVYNSENFLKNCLNSIKAQSYTNYEVLIVDDGSTDCSYSIAREFQEKDCRFKVFKQDHQGIVGARNYALDKVKGRYIAFVDSDDTVTPYYLESLKHSIESGDYDIVVCNFTIENEVIGEEANKDRRLTTKNTVVDVSEFLCSVFSLKTHHEVVTGGFLWNKLFKKEVIQEIRFHLTPGAEDELFLFLIAKNIDKVLFISDTLYHYRLHLTSLSNSESFLINFIEGRFVVYNNAYQSKYREMIKAACIQATVALVYRTMNERFDQLSQIINASCFRCSEAIKFYDCETKPFLKKTYNRFVFLLFLSKIPKVWFILSYALSRNLVLKRLLNFFNCLRK